ncbi:MAG TPA: SMP-30/gluconolactonase/LRE family protein, partial [Mycobacterium sp.]|nr:SMP-30/gluconolactonase/LRE family protein [Mycobacterium sp.]
NCMALDHDETYLYVVRTTAADVVRFRIDGDVLGPEERFGPTIAADGSRSFADGCGFDALGNLWVTDVTCDRIVAVTPQRQVVPVTIDSAGLVVAPTSVAWGGDDRRDIYIGSLGARYVLRGRSSVPGMAMVHQR